MQKKSTKNRRISTYARRVLKEGEGVKELLLFAPFSKLMHDASMK